MSVDTSAEAVERLVHDCDLAAGALRHSPSVKLILQDASKTLRALTAQLTTARAEALEAAKRELHLDLEAAERIRDEERGQYHQGKVAGHMSSLKTIRSLITPPKETE